MSCLIKVQGLSARRLHVRKHGLAVRTEALLLARRELFGQVVGERAVNETK